MVARSQLEKILSYSQIVLIDPYSILNVNTTDIITQRHNFNLSLWLKTWISTSLIYSLLSKSDSGHKQNNFFKANKSPKMPCLCDHHCYLVTEYVASK